MAIVLETITHVSYGGRIIPPGEKISVDDKHAEKLIKGGSAKVANGEAVKNRKRKADTDEKDV